MPIEFMKRHIRPTNKMVIQNVKKIEFKVLKKNTRNFVTDAQENYFKSQGNKLSHLQMNPKQSGLLLKHF